MTILKQCSYFWLDKTLSVQHLHCWADPDRVFTTCRCYYLVQMVEVTYMVVVVESSTFHVGLYILMFASGIDTLPDVPILWLHTPHYMAAFPVKHSTLVDTLGSNISIDILYCQIQNTPMGKPTVQCISLLNNWLVICFFCQINDSCTIQSSESCLWYCAVLWFQAVWGPMFLVNSSRVSCHLTSQYTYTISLHYCQ